MVQYCSNLFLKGCNILFQWNVPLYFALVFANSCPSLSLITGCICKPDMPFSQLIGPVFSHSSLVGIAIRYLLKVRCRVTWSFIILNLLFTLSAFAHIRLCPIPRFLGCGLGRRYVAISAADTNPVPSVGRSERISSTFLGAVFIAPVIIMHATLLQFGPCQGNVHYAPSCYSRIYDHRDYHMFIEPQCHFGQESLGPVDKCVYRATVSFWARVPWPCW